MKPMHIPLAIALLSALTSCSVEAETPADIKKACLHGDVFQKAAASGDVELVEKCIGADTPIDSAEGNGWTPLHSASFGGQNDVVIWLLKAGADRTLKDKNGKTPLDLAISKKHQEIVEIFNDPAYKVVKEPSDDSDKGLSTSDPKSEKLAEELRFELNNYGPSSSDDSIDYQIAEILGVDVTEGGDNAAVATYKITVKFKTGIVVEGTDEVIYEGVISENANGHLSVTKYDYADE